MCVLVQGVDNTVLFTHKSSSATNHIIKAETISRAGGRAVFAGVKGRQRGFIFSASGRGLAPGSLLPGDAKSVSAHALTDEVLIVTA